MKAYNMYKPFEFKYSDYTDTKIRGDMLEMRDLYWTDSTIFKLKLADKLGSRNSVSVNKKITVNKLSFRSILVQKSNKHQLWTTT